MSNIVIFAAGWLGDNIMLNSLVLELRKIQDNRITIFNPHPQFSGLFERMAGVSDVISGQLPRRKLAFIKRLQYAQEIAKYSFDEIIVAPNTFKSGLLAYMSGIKKRTGWHGEARCHIINNRHMHVGKYPTMVQTYVALAHSKHSKLIEFTKCPQPKLIADDIDMYALASSFNIVIPKKNYKNIMLCPGAAFGETKRWPTKHFAELAQHMLQNSYNVHIMGGPSEVGLAREIQQKCNNKCIDWTGKSSIAQAIDILAKADCVVANDSGLMHMGAALERPVVALYGATKPSFAPPLSDIATSLWVDVECRPCGARICPLNHNKCLDGIKPMKVIDAINNLLLNKSNNNPSQIIERPKSISQPDYT